MNRRVHSAKPRRPKEKAALLDRAVLGGDSGSSPLELLVALGILAMCVAAAAFSLTEVFASRSHGEQLKTGRRLLPGLRWEPCGKAGGYGPPTAPTAWRSRHDSGPAAAIWEE